MTSFLIVAFAVSVGYIAADLTPGVRGPGIAVFAGVLLVINAIRWLAKLGAKERNARRREREHDRYMEKLRGFDTSRNRGGGSVKR